MPAARPGAWLQEHRRDFRWLPPPGALVPVGSVEEGLESIALLSDYPSAYGVLGSFDTDLDLYRDTLSEGDIDGIAAMESLAEARRRITVSLLLTVVILVLAAGAFVYALVSS